MKPAVKKSTLIQEFARKVGHAAGKVVAATQELAGSAVAMVNHDAPATHVAQASSPAGCPPRKHSPRLAAKKGPRTSTILRPKSKKSAVAKKSARIKAAAPESR